MLLFSFLCRTEWYECIASSLLFVVIAVKNCHAQQQHSTLHQKLISRYDHVRSSGRFSWKRMPSEQNPIEAYLFGFGSVSVRWFVPHQKKEHKFCIPLLWCVTCKAIKIAKIFRSNESIKHITFRAIRAISMAAIRLMLLLLISGSIENLNLVYFFGRRWFVILRNVMSKQTYIIRSLLLLISIR